MENKNTVDPENNITMEFSDLYITNIYSIIRKLTQAIRISALNSSTITIRQLEIFKSDTHLLKIRMPLNEDALHDLAGFAIWYFESRFTIPGIIDIYNNGYLSSINRKDLETQIFSDHGLIFGVSARTEHVFESIKKIIKWEDSND